MEAERWQKLDLFFATAADLTSDQRHLYLDQACDGDSELREELESMLQTDAELADATQKGLMSVIEATASNLAAEQDSVDPLIGSFVGPYRAVALLGRGGMGAVYRAVREDDQFRKEVAIKVIPRLLAGPEAIARFRAERQILANLEHPNIARLLDGGTSQGTPYLVMEYIEGGVPITQYAADKALPLHDRLALIRSVCSAVQYAHTNLVVHRDLKPANILVSADGVVKLLDFGVAKLMDRSTLDTGGKYPQTSAQMITPDFASPEQIRGEAVTTSTDVYSLGIVLYELLTGERPYRLTGQSQGEMARLICDTEPRRPSEVELVSRRLRRTLAGDLDNIVLMAIRKDPLRRYQSPDHFAADIRRYLEGKPVQARPDTWAYRSGKFLTRNRWPVAAGFVVIASLLTGIVISTRQARVARSRFDQLRGFARTILVDLDGQLSDIPGTARARQALTAHVSDYLNRIIADNSADDAELATEIATTYLRLSAIQGSTPVALASIENGRRLLEAKRQRGAADAADLLLLARLRLRMGTTLVDLGRTTEGKENLLAALALTADSGVASGLEAIRIRARADWRLARISRVQYRLDDSESHARAAVAACEKVLQMNAPRDREIDEIYNGARLVLGGVLRRQGKWDQSLQIYSGVLADSKRRAAEDPGSAQRQRELARNHGLLADMLSVVPGRSVEVLENVRSSIAIGEKLVALDPQDKGAQSELAQALSLGAEALLQPEDQLEVERYLRRALPVFQSLLRREPESGTYLLYTGLTEAELGECLGRRNLNRDSIQRIRNGLQLVAKLVARDPSDMTNRIELLKLKRMLARNLARAGESQEALAVSTDVLARAREVSSVQGSQTEIPMRELPRAYALLGMVHRQSGHRDESQRWYRMAVSEWDSLRDKGYSLRDAERDILEAKSGLLKR